MRLWKAFKRDFQSDHGDVKWERGVWNHQDGLIEIRQRNGFHASERIIDAMPIYIQYFDI